MTDLYYLQFNTMEIFKNICGTKTDIMTGILLEYVLHRFELNIELLAIGQGAGINN